MEKLWNILRFWVIPILSVVATLFFSPDNHFTWVVWIATFVCVCEGGPSSAAMVRPAFWVGIHIAAVFMGSFF